MEKHEKEHLVFLPPRIFSTHILCKNDLQNISTENLLVTSANVINKQYEKAREMYEQLNDLPVIAKYDLAWMYFNGLGGERRVAHYWHQEATGNGSIESQTALGVMYENGIHVDKDVEASFKCFKSAAERGGIYAMGHLALQYYKQKMFKSAAAISKRVGSLEDSLYFSKKTDSLEVYVRKGIAIGCFVYARCIEQHLGDLKTNEDLSYWYKRAVHFDMDTSQYLQNFIPYGKI